MTAVRSGIARTLDNGVVIGGSDLREFAVGAGVPSGLTFHGTPGSPAIIDAGAEGNVFEENSVNSGYLEVDSFSGLISFGEYLVRGYIESAAGSGSRMRFGFGPYEMAIPPTPSGTDFFLFQSFSNSIRWAGASLPGAGQAAGVTTELNEGDPPGGFAEFYFWLRMRLTDVGGGFSRFQGHFTFSDFDMPPAVPGTWDIDETSSQAVEQPSAALAKMGWVRTTIGPTQISRRRIGFISFSDDLTFTEQPPLPTEVFDQDASAVPPSVTVDPIQGTWVGLRSSPVELF